MSNCSFEHGTAACKTKCCITKSFTVMYIASAKPQDCLYKKGIPIQRYIHSNYSK